MPPRQKLAAITLIPALLLALAYVVWMPFDPRGTRLKALFQGPEYGLWAAETLDGDRLRGTYQIAIEDGEIVGGYDGCNRWWYAGIDPATGLRVIETTLVGCRDTAEAVLMRRLARGSAKIQLTADDRLRVEAAGHAASFRRVPAE